MLTKAGKEKVDRLFSFYGGMAKLFGVKTLPSYSPPKIACVYAFDMSDNTVKIGVTTNVENRKKSVECAVYLDVLRIHCTDFAPRMFMYTIEGKCHKTFKPFHVRGEYFAIPFDDACTELYRYRDDIAVALKTADENFIDELNYYEELKEQFINSYVVTPFEQKVTKLAPVKESIEIYLVYVLLMSDNNVIIGCTKNLIARVAKIKRETGLTVVDMYFTPYMPRDNARFVEWASQEVLSAWRVKGEIFSVNFSKARATIRRFVKLTAVKLPSESVNLIADK